MGLFEELGFRAIYARAGRRPERLPWHRDEPPRLLRELAAARGGQGRALDAGCGSGVASVFLAGAGFRVTAVDYLAPAVDMARARFAAAGVDVELVQADLLAWEPPAPFDVVVDSECLESLATRERPAWHRGLRRWLAPGGDLLLVHFERRGLLDWSPFGPRRRSRAAIEAPFAPDLELRGYEPMDVHDGPWFLGPSYRLGVWWWRRASGR